MIKQEKLQVENELLNGLPLFYNYVQYNEMINVDVYSTPRFSEKYTSYIPSCQAGKLVSKIIDFSVLNDDL